MGILKLDWFTPEPLLALVYALRRLLAALLRLRADVREAAFALLIPVLYWDLPVSNAPLERDVVFTEGPVLLKVDGVLGVKFVTDVGVLYDGGLYTDEDERDAELDTPPLLLFPPPLLLFPPPSPLILLV